MESLSLNPSAQSDEREEPVKKSPALGFWKMAFAVFVGNILTGLLGAFIYSLR
jgi:hypothetical protein